MGEAERGGRNIWLIEAALKDTMLHEFGHLLGLGHQLDTTNSIMNYSPEAAILPSDVKRLVHWYYGPYLDGVMR